jgi:hypothetical protein
MKDGTNEVEYLEHKPCEEHDDARELKRVGVYGLQLADLLEQSIIVGPDKHVRFSGVEKGSDGPGLVRLPPTNLDDVKRWIGVPDELAAKRSCCGQFPAEVPGVASAAELRKLDATSRLAIRDLAYEYVHGDSRRLSSYKPILDKLVDRAIITGVFLRLDIDIHRGAVLEVGRDIRVLFARHIRIFRGGLLKLTGDAKIDCVSITGNLLDIKFVDVVVKYPAFASVLNSGGGS